MKVLVTGGSGLIGAGVITALLRRGHTVRILSRHAGEEASIFSGQAEAFDGDVSDPDSVRGSARGCDAVLHIAGIAEEKAPEQTFERINVEGTRHILAEAERARAGRFVYVSSLGAERGSSGYHHSKLAAEHIAEQFQGNFTIVRPGNVYGPGDDVLSTLLTMVRSLPVVPVIDFGEYRFQPIWHEDLAEFLALCLERDDLSGEILEVAGPDVTTTNEVLHRLSILTGRNALPLPVPNLLASLGASVANALGVHLPINENKIRMLLEGNVVEPPEKNALGRLGVKGTALQEGLRRMAEDLPEQLPSEGVGPMIEKRFWADMQGCKQSPEQLRGYLCNHFYTIMPLDVGVEHEKTGKLKPGMTITAALPLRGHISMRVAEVRDHWVTLTTLKGHPLAGAVSFTFLPLNAETRFEVRLVARAADFADGLIMNTVGDVAQSMNWVTFVERVIQACGATAPKGVQTERRTLDEAEARQQEEWIAGLVQEQKQEQFAAQLRA